MTQGHGKHCGTPPTVAIPSDGGGDDPDGDNIQDNPHPTVQKDQEADQPPAAQIEWGEDTVQDANMLAYGFFINTKWRLAICMTCYSGIGAENLHRHLNHDLKQLGLSVSRNYCTSIVTKYSLLPRSKLIPPTSIIPAIYGLPIESNMQYCSSCGYAAHIRSSIVRHHRLDLCQGSAILSGPAQTFFPTTNREYFAVVVPLAKQPKPDAPIPISTLFKSQFLPEIVVDTLITIPSNTRDMNHFLSLGNWFQEVEGLTGKEAHHISRYSQPELRVLVRKSIDLYVKERNKELKELSDNGVKTAMGDYNK